MPPRFRLTLVALGVFLLVCMGVVVWRKTEDRVLSLADSTVGRRQLKRHAPLVRNVNLINIDRHVRTQPLAPARQPNQQRAPRFKPLNVPAEAVSPPKKAPHLRMSPIMLNRFIVVPEYKLLFCYIEKVGCKFFNALFMSVRSKFDPSLAEGFGWPWYRNTPAVHGLKVGDIAKIMANPAWHKAVFYREPLERFLSGYKSKCEDHADKDRKNCEIAFGARDASFVTAVRVLQAKARKKEDMGNVHYKQQYEFCGGLGHTLPYYDTIERLDPDTSQKKVGDLLQKVGVDPATVPFYTKYFEQYDTLHKVGGKHKHVLRSDKHVLQYYTSPQILCAVALYYRKDYELFNMKLPAWVEEVTGTSPDETWALCDALANSEILGPGRPARKSKESKGSDETPSKAGEATAAPVAAPNVSVAAGVVEEKEGGGGLGEGDGVEHGELVPAG